MSALWKLIIAGFGGLIVAVLIFLLLVNPSLAKVNSLNNQAKEKKTTLISLEKQIKAYQTAQADLSQATERMKISDSLVIREDLEVAVISVERSASLSNIEESKKIADDIEDPLEEPRQQVVSNKKLIQEVPYHLTTKGNFIAMINFLKYLENLPQFSEVTEITLTAEVIENKEEEAPPIRTGQILGDIEALFFIRIP